MHPPYQQLGPENRQSRQEVISRVIAQSHPHQVNQDQRQHQMKVVTHHLQSHQVIPHPITLLMMTHRLLRPCHHLRMTPQKVNLKNKFLT